MNDLIIKDKHDLLDVSDNSLLTREFRTYYIRQRKNLVYKISQIYNCTENIKDIIDPKKSYVLKIPKDVLQKIEDGKYDFFRDKKGGILASIIDTTLPKNRNLVHNLRAEEIDVNLKDKISNLQANIADIAIQEQLADLSHMLIKMQKVLIEVKRGQMTDRIGLVYSGKNQLEQAFQLPDSDPNKRELIRSAIKGINDGRSQLELALKDEFRKEVNIPKNKLKLIIKSLFDSEYYNEIESRYFTIQEGMNAYFDATRLLVLSYTVIDSKEAIPKVLEPMIEFLEVNHKKIKDMSGLALFGIQNDDNWYENPQRMIDTIHQSNQFELPDNIEFLAIEISGQELLSEVEDE